MASKEKALEVGVQSSGTSFWLGGNLIDRIRRSIRVKILCGNVFDYYDSVLTVLDSADTDYHQLTISPALFEAIAEDRYEKYRQSLLQASKKATIHLAHIEEDFLKNSVFKEWQDSAKASGINPPIRVSELKKEYSAFNAVLKNLKRGLARTQLDPINNDPKTPMPMLISVANTQTQDSAKGLVVSFEFSRCIRQSYYRGFYTDQHDIAMQIKHIFDAYVKSMA